MSTTTLPTTEHQNTNTISFGFWVYLMTDCVLFASLFAVYGVLQGSTFDGAVAHGLFNLPNVLIETIILLTSSLTCGMAMLAAHRQDKMKTLAWFTATFVLGIAFLVMELSEFSHLVTEGNSWRASGFLSSYFTLVGAHGLHISFGLLWIVVLMALVWGRGLSSAMITRLTLLSLFWHFLDIIWIFIFTVVYLMGGR